MKDSAWAGTVALREIEDQGPDFGAMEHLGDFLYRQNLRADEELIELLYGSHFAQKIRAAREITGHQKRISVLTKHQFLMALYMEAPTQHGVVECGVWKGFSAALLLQTKPWKDIHLVDSWEGLSQPGWHDGLEGQGGKYTVSHGKGFFAYPFAEIRKALGDYPVTFHKGFVPEILSDLPDQEWGFVHLDMDLYAPTLAALHYFVPRLAPGGIIVEDDFASNIFPGAGRAWLDSGYGFTALSSGQAVHVNGLAQNAPRN